MIAIPDELLDVIERDDNMELVLTNKATSKQKEIFEKWNNDMKKGLLDDKLIEIEK